MDVNTLPDRIGDTFKETTVFISGGTGFVGKALIDKLLRSTDVKRLYLLIRPKKGKSPHERIHDIFSNVVRTHNIIYTFFYINIYSLKFS